MIVQWREVLHETILYGMLFKAIALDAEILNQNLLKMSYRPMMDSISMWAERQHHKYRNQFVRLGGKIHVQKKEDDFLYFVLVSIHGRQEKCIYNAEILKAECQVRLNNYLYDAKQQANGRA